ncbi:prolyl oligopeptidase family serine peptidase [Georgenia subflava]|uniref:Prolyl oligopeptidase family serine peptidase n=1 Tax=Georgenia subflava TaxID=1622177 RepID=A0A6N7EE73_9MICO|nr:prolyl oligopeptidase family serine peptidase [Georgenia subflava]MPV36409.1 prolyl oligopeptidase family serine peptidase [Georgenia subflava]
MTRATDATAALDAAGTAVTIEPEDRYAWLEDVEGDEQLAWVRERNAHAEEVLAGARFEEIRRGTLEVLDSTDKIPAVVQRGEFLYNFWTDADHERGLWRRTTWDSYRTAEPEWDVLIDVDALNAAEGANWVWHGAHVLRPSYDRALVQLSRGGSDADITREFDLTTRTWVPDGFTREESKGGIGWADSTGDVVFVYTDVGEGSMTTSGYPRTVRRWRRGTPIEEAPELYAGETTDMLIGAGHDFTPGFERDLVFRHRAFYDSDLYLLGPDDTLTLLDLPASAEPDLFREWLTVELREEWEVGGRTYPGGSLLAVALESFLTGGRDFEVLYTPSATTSLAGASWTRHHLVLNILDDVANRLEVLTPPADGAAGVWRRRPLDLSGGTATGEVPALATIAVGAVDPDAEDALWLTTTGFLTPTTLSRLDLDDDGATVGLERLKSLPAYFDTTGLHVEQHFVASADGTRVPYFQVSREPVADDAEVAPMPTLLAGYGGFEISRVPAYSGGIGRAWLERGGVYVVANIRGGGEYGPRWHQAALKANRHKAYEDFAAVARDLVARGVTDTEHLGAQGGSNGGLLMGNMLTQYPELFGAIVCQVPLLDMKRYSHLLAGASWMAEYGDPDDPEQWDFIRHFSAYHLFDAAGDYPPVLFTTSTRDDRVHPGHARKMAAQMIDAGKDVTYYENIEGGHGGAATNAQAALMQALAFEFLWQRIG